MRTLRSSDWSHIPNEDPRQIGLAIIQQVCSLNGDAKSYTPLSDDDLQQLTPEDCKLLAPAIAKRNTGHLFHELANGAGEVELGEEALLALQRHQEKAQLENERIKKAVIGSYDFLSKDTQAKFQAQLSDVVRLSEHPRKDREFSGNEFKPDPPVHFRPQSFDESPAGRALLRSAEHTRESSKRLEELVGHIGGLQQTIMVDVLPQWQQQIDADRQDAIQAQAGAKQAFEQAERGLRLSRLAMWASIFVAIVTTVFQVSFSLWLDAKNSPQQEAQAKRQQRQLELQQEHLEQQAQETAALKASIESLKGRHRK